MKTATEIAACGLAAGSLVDFWLESSLLATARAKVEARGGRIAELAGSRFCLSFHAAWMAAPLWRRWEGRRGLPGDLAAGEAGRRPRAEGAGG
jgi:hypothetical protein